jgi:chemotaxis-related protein WspD
MELEPCWQSIGVYGDSSCPELATAIHCRNCKIYSNAGLQLLNRPMPKEYRREWSIHFAQAKHSAVPTKISAVIFRLHREWLALPTQAFQEVAEWRKVHSLPHRRNSIVLGLINIRGELLICVALDRMLGLEEVVENHKGAASHDRLLVVHWDGQRLVFPVHEVEGIHRFQTQDLKEPPATVAKATSSFTSGLLRWEERAVGLLDAPLLFSALNRSLA